MAFERNMRVTQDKLLGSEAIKGGVRHVYMIRGRETYIKERHMRAMNYLYNGMGFDRKYYYLG